MGGRYCYLEHVDAGRHEEDLFAAYAEAPDYRRWTYLPLERSPNLAHYLRWLGYAAESRARSSTRSSIKPSTDQIDPLAAELR